jgi:hypothetical protein
MRAGGAKRSRKGVPLVAASFATIAELTEALREFLRRSNRDWLIERHGFRSPAQVRRDLMAPIPAVA